MISVMAGVHRSNAARCAALALLAACSGGGGGSSSSPQPSRAPTPAPTVSTAPTWEPGTYPASSTLANRCERPRTGVDLEGNPFPDRAGSLAYEKFWLRSWTHETYLWANEVPDRNPANYASPVAYFDTLKTTATTPSGTPKDDFHFSQPTEDYLRDRNSAPAASYGARLAVIDPYPPREVRVVYTDPGTPAAPVLARGDRILSVDGEDLVYGGETEAALDTINDGLFPRAAGETHVFEVQDTEGRKRSVTITSANLSEAPVNTVRVLDRDGGKVGYLLLNTFSPYATEAALADAVQTLADEAVSDLVLDLRYNGGGLLAIASQLSHMIAGPAYTRGQTFEQLRFNTGVGGTNPITGGHNDPVPFFAEGLGFSYDDGAVLPVLNLRRVYILTTEATCSASEAVINGLRGVDFEVELIGSTTCGKPYGFYPEDNCGQTYYTIQFQGVNDKGFGDYADGFAPTESFDGFAVSVPGCSVADDYTYPLGDPRERMLAAALQRRETGACPGLTMAKAAAPAWTRGAVQSGPPLIPRRAPLADERDMRLPGGRL
ncbi:S41 family peptidase [Parvularcula dongshanensis]|uniref:C-terminal processing protease CtpA/Prc n=1 Tax=Parvularcula dongshanensis TaxID=1173995 RepID=A0A840I299_9PROT|nr:S41 family peptidase [Parvularcula dongshanensis]MBB4658318.1 C-terminal processing protease CtpA/Prc [Parvularcula dongshanensis]